MNSSQVTAQVDFQRVATIYHLTPQPVIAGALYSVMVGWIMWGLAPAALVVPWVAFRLVLCAVRINESRLFARDTAREARVSEWRMRYIAFMVLEGWSWSAMGLLFLPFATGMIGMLLFTSVLCIAGVGVFTLVSHFPTAIVNLLATLLPMAAYYAYQGGTEGWFVCTGIGIYIVVLLNESWRSDARWVDMARLRFENAAIAESHEQALRQAEAASAAKSAFLATMSHEIRTPLNGMIGLTEMLLQGETAPQRRHYLDLSLQSADHLLQLVDQVLDMSKIQAGGLTLDPAPFSLETLLEELAPLFAGRAATKGLDLLCHVDPGLPARITGDPLRLRQVLANLIGNAIKFTEAGHVQLSVAIVREPPAASPGARVTLRFAVSDTGPGIALEKQKAVFEAFTQADNSTARRYGGTGLGLTISAALVELMGTRLELDSTPGEGSTFRFDVSFPVVAGEPAQAAPYTHHPGLRAAWVESNAAERQWYTRLLEAWGASAQPAGTLNEALGLLERGTDVVFLSGNMFDRCSADDAKRFTEAVGRARVVLLMGPRDAMPDWLAASPLDVRREIRPLTARALNRCLQTLPVTAAAPLAPAPPAPVLSLEGMQVLLCEDNDVNALIATKSLERAGAEVVRVASGGEGVAAVQSRRFDAVLMDLQMPDMDGLEATRHIRAWERARGDSPLLPILALTANAMPDDREACAAAGMTGYMTKPIRPAHLIEVLRQAVASGPAPASTAATPPSAAARAA